jgi:arylsulfatase
LCNLDEDWAQAHDLAAEQPDKLAQMKGTFSIHAAARNSARRWRSVGSHVAS